MFFLFLASSIYFQPGSSVINYKNIRTKIDQSFQSKLPISNINSISDPAPFQRFLNSTECRVLQTLCFSQKKYEHAQFAQTGSRVLRERKML